MPIFSERSFQDLMDKLLVVHPMDKNCMTGVGYDLNIGYFIEINRRLKKVVAIKEVKEDDTNIFELKSDHYLVVITREYVYLSCRVAATFHSKSTLAAQAIFLNSTTGDPNWDGKLIFLLYNAAGSSVGIRLDESFCTMVVHDIERRSYLLPKESKTVLDKYIEGFGTNVAPAIHYILKKNNDYNKRVEKAKQFAQHSTPIIIFLILYYRYFLIKKSILLKIVTALVLIFSISLLIKSPKWIQVAGLNGNIVSILGSIFSIFSGGYLLIQIYRTYFKKNQNSLKKV